MSKSRCAELCEIGDRLFSTRGTLESLWQDIAENFFPERADFTSDRSLGDDFASSLMTGYPALQLRELADQLAAMLRPRSKLWARLTASNDEVNEDVTASTWLEWASERTRKAMYTPPAQFLRATKTADADFVAFGQAVILPSLTPENDGLLYRTFHLRDVAWSEGRDGQIECVHRREKRSARDVVKYYPRTVGEQVRRQAEKEPYEEINIRHIVVPSDMYDSPSGGKRKLNTKKFPFYAITLDKDNDTVLEEVPQHRLGYVIPRWRLGAFAQYAVSPCTMLALPDARLLQTMTLSLLEAGEKAANPPMVAVVEAVRTDMQLYAGGTTWVDREYDERLGEALRPLQQDLRGISHGQKMLEDVREIMKHIFFLNQINLPQVTHEMTAFETRKRVEEHVRAALPLFEPMETEYNSALMNETFAIIIENNGFGPLESMPDVLRGADVHFEFESPLQATAERAKSLAFREAAEVLQIAVQVDPNAVHQIDLTKAVPDALRGVEVPADWLRDPKAVAALVQAANEARAQQQKVADMGQAAEIANKAAPMVSAINR